MGFLSSTQDLPGSTHVGAVPSSQGSAHPTLPRLTFSSVRAPPDVHRGLFCVTENNFWGNKNGQALLKKRF